MAEYPDEESFNRGVWNGFAARNSGNPHLGLDALYALSPQLIDLIRNRIPRFFSPTQIEFERDLAATASFGFFLQKPIGVRLPQSLDESIDQKFEESGKRIKEMLAEEYRNSGISESQIHRHLDNPISIFTEIGEIKKSYHGWLITNPDFIYDIIRFRNKWEQEIRRYGGFPKLPNQWASDSIGSWEALSAFEKACLEFFSVWGLETLVTWHWPIPMDPDLDVGNREQHPFSSFGGVSLYIPWYLLRERTLDFQRIISEFRNFHVPPHLASWVAKRESKKGRLGENRFAKSLTIYRYFVLSLLKRYPDKCEANVSDLDKIFGEFNNCGKDTIKTQRLIILRTIRSAECCEYEGVQKHETVEEVDGC